MNTPKTAIIGAGKIAYTVAAALFKKGAAPSLVISKNIYSAESLAYTFSVSSYSDDIKSLTEDFTNIIIATPDNEIIKVARSVSKLRLPFNGQLYLHLSGAFGLEQLDPLRKAGAHTASLHIMQSFPNKIPQNIKGMLAAIEHSSPAALRRIKSLCVMLEVEPYSLKPGMKNYYHTAGVFASNFLIGNLHTSMAIAKEAGINEELYKKIFIKITEATLSNAKSAGIDEALSGPIERNDIVTVKRHIQALKRRNTGQQEYAVMSYLIQSLLLTEAAEAKNPTVDYNLLKSMLKNELSI